jgi:N utilization substance protein A
VVLSRSHSDFMRKLFTMEVPEIESGIVEIKNIAREPGSRSKIAVVSNDDRVDAVGACVGMKGSRVQSVVRELGGERIDVVLWSDSPIAFVTRALSPAKVVHAQMDEGDNKATVVVADDQLSLAIGKGGQNARLAAKLTGLKIDLINESQYSERLEFEKMAKVPVADVPGVDEGIGAALAAAGYDTAQHLAKAAVTDLAAIDGLDEGKARAIIDAARQCITEIRDRSKAERPEAAPAEQDAGGGSEAQAEEVEGPDETSADDAGGASVGGPDVPGDEPGASGEIEGDVT